MRARLAVALYGGRIDQYLHVVTCLRVDLPILMYVRHKENLACSRIVRPIGQLSETTSIDRCLNAMSVNKTSQDPSISAWSRSLPPLIPNLAQFDLADLESLFNVNDRLRPIGRPVGASGSYPIPAEWRG